MERLTQKTDYCAVFCRMEDRKECAYWTGCVGMKCGDARIYDRLAAYEDTGLEPEEVNRCKLTLMGKSLAEITEFDGVSIERLKELVRAEKAGRLVVLPCRVGDTVYFVFKGKVHEVRVQGMPIGTNNQVFLNFGGYPVQYAWASEVGKTVFLTQEEAKRALEGGADHA